MMRTMSACCLTAYAKSPGFAILGTELSVGIVRERITVEKIAARSRFGKAVEFRLIPLSAEEKRTFPASCRISGPQLLPHPADRFQEDRLPRRRLRPRNLGQCAVPQKSGQCRPHRRGPPHSLDRQFRAATGDLRSSECG